jgi:Zn ribbon nucleic-acid-binding protein
MKAVRRRIINQYTTRMRRVMWRENDIPVVKARRCGISVFNELL